MSDAIRKIAEHSGFDALPVVNAGWLLSAAAGEEMDAPPQGERFAAAATAGQPTARKQLERPVVPFDHDQWFANFTTMLQSETIARIGIRLLLANSVALA